MAPCKNGGTCVAQYEEGGFKCKCPVAFAGAFCENGEICDRPIIPFPKTRGKASL